MNGTRNNASYTEVRDRIALQTKDLRSSHFDLGKEKDTGQASSAAMFQAPPAKALIRNTSESEAAKLRIQRSNFTLKDGTVGGMKQPLTST